MDNKKYHKSIMSNSPLKDVLYDYKCIAESIEDDDTYQSADTGILLYHLGIAIEYLEELKKLRKAYELMAVKYCKHTECYFCEVADKCELYLGTKKGSENLMEYFLKEAQKDE